MNIKSEDAPLYDVTPCSNDDAIIAKALEILRGRMNCGDVFNNPADVKAYFQTLIAQSPRELFVVMFLDTQHRMIETRELFAGTIDAASVYPREVVKAALELNASAVLFAHNHPSGHPEPSEADKRITLRLRDALSLVDIRTLDHIVVGLSGTVSMAERGLL